jgi:hypothetical protein
LTEEWRFINSLPLPVSTTFQVHPKAHRQEGGEAPSLRCILEGETSRKAFKKKELAQQVMAATAVVREILSCCCLMALLLGVADGAKSKPSHGEDWLSELRSIPKPVYNASRKYKTYSKNFVRQVRTRVYAAYVLHLSHQSSNSDSIAQQTYMISPE